VFAPKLTWKTKQCIIKIPIQQFVHNEKKSEKAKTLAMEAMHKSSISTLNKTSTSNDSSHAQQHACIARRENGKMRR
jgi:hypothetical protein